MSKKWMMEARHNLADNSLKLQGLRETAFKCAGDGHDTALELLLKDSSPEEIDVVLNTPTKCGTSLETTPLIIAARKGHLAVVRTLLAEFGVSVEQTGMVEFSGHPVIKGASPLWCAASIGHLEMVKMLVEEFGADVNHATITNSTPLRPACFDGFLEVVEYLISKGAEVNRPTNYYSNTCLLIASYNGHRKVVKFLLENGARHEMRDFMGQTALHNAAEKGHIEIAMDLIEHGAQFLPDHKKLTPLHVACDFNRVEMVNVFLALDCFTTLDKIHALELLGASFANGSEDYDIEKAYKYLHEAMELRYQDPENLYKKKVLDPEEVYGFQVESTTLDELERIEHDENLINKEALIVKERILGKYSVHILDIVYRGAVLADRRDYTGCMQMWDRALEIKKHNKESLANDLERYGELFSEMLEGHYQVKPADLLAVLEHCIKEIQTDQERLQTRTHDPEIARIHSNMKQIVHTVFLLVSALLDCPNPEDSTQDAMKGLVYKLVRLRPVLKLRDNATCLHLACDAGVEMNEYFIQSLVICPHPKVAAILLECGMDPNIRDKHGNTPLHVLCRSISALQPIQRKIKEEFWLGTCRELLDYGAHIDLRNKDGKMAIDYAKSPWQRDLLRPEMNRRSLKCLAAVAVTAYNLHQTGVLPRTLVEFASKH